MGARGKDIEFQGEKVENGDDAFPNNFSNQKRRSVGTDCFPRFPKMKDSVEIVILDYFEISHTHIKVSACSIN